ncbi:MAG: hypothetical protein ACRC0J_18055, partial [Shewanella oncorhynchi]
MSYVVTATGDDADKARIESATNPEANGAAEGPEVKLEGTESQQAELVAEQVSEEAQVAEVTEPELFFGGEQVEVSIPDDIQSAFTEKGIDVNEVVSELFAKDGNFSLSEATRAKLDEAFSKPLVDAYLNLYKGQNDLSLGQIKKEAEAHQATVAANTSDFNELVGGDEGWDSMAAWAGESLSEDELASFNAVMQLPAEHFVAQRMVTEALKSRYQAATKEQGSDAIKLLSDDGGTTTSSISEGLPQTLTKEQYQAQLFTDRYKKEPEYAAAIDNIRR